MKILSFALAACLTAASSYAEVLRVDPARKIVVTDQGDLPFDYAIVASGAATNFFGNAAIERTAFDLKDLPGALRLRNHLIRRFEAAIAAADPEERRALLTIAVAGGGPTGVEVAGAVSELLRRLLGRDYPALRAEDVTVLLFEGGPRVLAAFPESLSRAAARSLARLGVEVRTGTLVASYDGAAVRLRSGETIRAGTLVWAAGVKASPLPATLGVPLDLAGRVPVLPTLQMREHPHVFVVGDAAHLDTPSGPVPALAPPAMQMGRTAAENLARLIEGEPLRPFVYKDPGTMATIGRKAAVCAIHGLKLTGFVAWVTWLFVHLMQLVGFRNRVVVFVDWAFQYIFYRPASPIILSIEEDALHNKVLDESTPRA
jgi:NADH dehydrogenase